MRKDVFNQLSANLRGSVITPESSEYDAARKVYNGMIDRRPAAIARCADVADVRTAVNFARQAAMRTVQCIRRSTLRRGEPSVDALKCSAGIDS
jgi:hypothetical protein